MPGIMFHTFSQGIFMLKIALTLSTFVIDYEKDQFLKDGQPFRYVSGSLHYVRVPRDLWSDRLTKIRLAGLNAVQTYIEWSIHEPEPGNFYQIEDVTDFIRTAQGNDLLVILRPGPYICAERDFGGFPYWLLRDNPKMSVRSYDASYLKLVDRYLSKILPAIRPFLYVNGGPVIMVQIENEYGNYGCNKQYTAWLRDTFKKYLVDDVVLFTTDSHNDHAVNCGKIDGVYATVDFSSSANVTSSFAVQRRVEPKGPLVNSEYYPGWFDLWSKPHQTLSTGRTVKTLREILDVGASVNVYMFHGGTNFGFKNGASGDAKSYQPGTTSYDYDAPLTEAGDPTEKYFAIRDLIGQYLPLPNGTLPQPAPKFKLDKVQLYRFASLSQIMAHSDCISAQYPLTFGQLKFDGGHVIYRTKISVQSSDPSDLHIPGLRDRAQVILDGHLVGILSRTDSLFTLPLQAQNNSDLVILVENQGRINHGGYMRFDEKGITGNVTLGETELTGWTHYYNYVGLFEKRGHVQDKDGLLAPAIYTASFSLPNITKGMDTYLRLDGWGKGVAYINGVNIGRYWPGQGPQVTLYVPHTWLFTDSDNYITLFETERAPCAEPTNCIISFTDEPILDGPTP
ncbi:Beta-galactosidase [Halotydeus destructor]|nr:Beta-galactosidase [Halotydeus destructor]